MKDIQEEIIKGIPKTYIHQILIGVTIGVIFLGMGIFNLFDGQWAHGLYQIFLSLLMHACMFLIFASEYRASQLAIVHKNLMDIVELLHKYWTEDEDKKERLRKSAEDLMQKFNDIVEKMKERQEKNRASKR